MVIGRCGGVALFFAKTPLKPAQTQKVWPLLRSYGTPLLKRVQAVPHDGRNAKLALGEVARHVGSGGAEFASMTDEERYM